VVLVPGVPIGILWWPGLGTATSMRPRSRMVHGERDLPPHVVAGDRVLAVGEVPHLESELLEEVRETASTNVHQCLGGPLHPACGMAGATQDTVALNDVEPLPHSTSVKAQECVVLSGWGRRGAGGLNF